MLVAYLLSLRKAFVFPTRVSQALIFVDPYEVGEVSIQIMRHFCSIIQRNRVISLENSPIIYNILATK